MKYSSALFDLIGSLSKSEKRYFRLHVSENGQENPIYLRLFEGISKQVKAGVYDEQALRKEFEGEGFVKQFHVAKNYLDQLICKCLVAFHTQNDAEARIYELLQSATILQNKGLSKQALKKLARGKKIATESHKHLLLAKVLEKEESIRIRLLDFGGAKEMMGAQKAVLADCNNILYNKYFGIKLYHYYLRSSTSRSAEDADAFQALINAEELKAENNATTVRSRIYKYTARVLYESFLGNSSVQFDFQKRITETYESFPKLIQENPREYLIALHNLAQIRYVRGEFTRVLILTERIRFTLEKYKVKRYPEVYIDALQGANEFDCWVNIRLCDAEAVEESLVLSEAFYAKFGNELNDHTTTNILYDVAIGWFYLDQSKRALKWLNELLSLKATNVREDLLHVAQLFNLAVHVDLANYELVASLERSLVRFLKQKGVQNAYEKLFLQFIKTWLRADISKERRSAFRVLGEKARQHEPKEWEKSFLEYFDMISWAEARSQSLPVLVQKKINDPVL